MQDRYESGAAEKRAAEAEERALRASSVEPLPRLAVGYEVTDSGRADVCRRCAMQPSEWSGNDGEVTLAGMEVVHEGFARLVWREEALRRVATCEVCEAQLAPVAWIVNPEDAEAIASGEGTHVLTTREDAEAELEGLSDYGSWKLYRVELDTPDDDMDAFYRAAMDASARWEPVR